MCAAEGIKERTGRILVEAADAQLHEETARLVGGRLAPARLAELDREGRALEFDQAVLYALQSLEELEAKLSGERLSPESHDYYAATA